MGSVYSYIFVGNLKKTYLGDHRPLMFECADVWIGIGTFIYRHARHISARANVWIGTFIHRSSTHADVWMCWCRFIHQHVSMPMNMYDYMLPGKCGRKFKTGYHTPETYKNNLAQRIMHAESNIPTSLLTKISFFFTKTFFICNSPYN